MTEAFVLGGVRTPFAWYGSSLSHIRTVEQARLAAAGITPDRVFTDTASCRAGNNRPGWTECMGYLREGDHLVVVAVDRLGRSVREVATALHELTSRGVHVRSLREGVDTSTPTGRARHQHHGHDRRAGTRTW